jgi:hypothetical protein
MYIHAETDLRVLRYLVRVNPLGIKIEIKRVKGKFNRSQEETQGDSDGVIIGFRGLGNETGQRVADLVEERRGLRRRRIAHRLSAVILIRTSLTSLCRTAQNSIRSVYFRR